MPLATEALSDDSMDEALMAHMDRIEAPQAMQPLDDDDAMDEALMAHMDRFEASAIQHQRASSAPMPQPPLPSGSAARAPRPGGPLRQLGLFQRPPPPPLPEYPVPDASSADPLLSGQRVIHLQFDRFEAGPASAAAAAAAPAAAGCPRARAAPRALTSSAT